MILILTVGRSNIFCVNYNIGIHHSQSIWIYVNEKRENIIIWKVLLYERKSYVMKVKWFSSILQL